MTALLLLIAVGATLANAAGACPAAPHVTVEVVARLDPVQKEFLGLREIEELRDRYGRAARHRTLGFYASAFFYTVRMDGTRDPAGCGVSNAVVELVLADRHVAVAQEAAGLRCLADVVARHYLRHVTLDEEAFGRLASRVRGAVASPGLSVRADATGTQAESVRELVRAAVETELPAYDDDRRTMQSEADNDAETARIADACS